MAGQAGRGAGKTLNMEGMTMEKILTERDLELIKPILSKKIRAIDWVLLEKGGGMEREKRLDLETKAVRLKKLFRQLYANEPAEPKAAKKPKIIKRKSQD